MNLIFGDIIRKFSSKKVLFVRLAKNTAEIKDIETGNLISRKSLEAFSNERLIVADFIIAEKFLLEIVNELLNHKNKSLKIVLQINDSEIKEICNTEKVIYQDLMCQIGVTNYWLIEHQKEINDEQILNIIK